MDYRLQAFDNAFDNLLNNPGPKAPIKKLGYVYDPEQSAYSYSRLQTLYSCPRKFQLKELAQASSYDATIHTSFGSAFGAGVQELWRSDSLPRATLALIAAWDYPAFEDLWGKDKHKSIFHCIQSLGIYHATVHQELSLDYRLAYLQGKPGIEFFAYMQIGSHDYYQVHIDLILETKTTGALVVLEIKTSGMVQQAANWENSLQTKGYFALLTVVSSKLGLPIAPKIIYITLQTGKLALPDEYFGFNVFHFAKPAYIASDFTLSLLQDLTMLDIYKADGHFPKRGHSCVSYNRPCEFFGICDDIPLTKAGNVYESLTLDDVDFYLTIDDLSQCNLTPEGATL